MQDIIRRLEEKRDRARKGRHTTTRSTLYRLSGGALVVDTPGIRELATGPVDSNALASVYPEITELAHGCRFRDCAHDTEPACAVRAALDSGALSEIRYASYRRLTTGLEQER